MAIVRSIASIDTHFATDIVPICTFFFTQNKRMKKYMHLKTARWPEYS